MKVLIVTTSRADWNGLGMVAKECVNRIMAVRVCAYTMRVDWTKAINDDGLIYDCGFEVIDRQCIEFQPDVAVVAGDRSELLEACITLCKYKVPICHIGGGEHTQGSMDDRYRNAITALTTIHCVETRQALGDIEQLAHHGDYVIWTGQPGLDRIKHTEPKPPPLCYPGLPHPTILVIVHPNTTHKDAMIDADAVIAALKGFRANVFALEPNRDPGHELLTVKLSNAFGKVISNLPPAQFYWLLRECDVLVGNSSAGTAEAACFGIPVVNVGDRQKGRLFGPHAWTVAADPTEIRKEIESALALRHKKDPWRHNPYGDGESAPRIVKALEDNAWRWS